MRIYSGSMSLRICPELNAKKQKSSPTQPRRKKPAMKPRVICQQCGLSLLDRHVLRRHVGYHLYTVYSGVPRESVFLLGTFAKLTEASFGGQMVVCFITSFCSVAGQKTPGQNLDADPDPDPDPGGGGGGEGVGQPKMCIPYPNPPDPNDCFGPPGSGSGSIPKCHGSETLPKGQCSFIFVQLPRCKKIKDEPRKYWHACDNCDYTASLPRYT